MSIGNRRKLDWEFFFFFTFLFEFFGAFKSSRYPDSYLAPFWGGAAFISVYIYPRSFYHLPLALAGTSISYIRSAIHPSIHRRPFFPFFLLSQVSTILKLQRYLPRPRALETSLQFSSYRPPFFPLTSSPPLPSIHPI